MLSTSIQVFYKASKKKPQDDSVRKVEVIEWLKQFLRNRILNVCLLRFHGIGSNECDVPCLRFHEKYEFNYNEYASIYFG